MDSPQQALDALQREINLILEQTGRLFAAASQPSPEAALARASRLKQQLPVSTNRFHQALDVLDEKIQFTKTVMRRDLAVARTKSGTETASKPVEVPSNTNVKEVAPEVVDAEPSELNHDQAVATAADQPQPESVKDEQIEPATSPKKRSSPSLEDDTSNEPAAKKQAVGTGNTVSTEAPASDSKLGVNTDQAGPASGEQSAEDKAPDTGTFSNTGDLDSLFNDTASGGGMGDDNGEEPDFSTSADLNAEFDMASFTNGLDANKSNDNDNISTLLPGLQDYANDTAGAEPDFSSFFNTEPTTNPPDQGQNTGTAGEGQQDDNTQHDNTFDDIFDMTFDMGGGEQSQNGGNDFDFDFS